MPRIWKAVYVMNDEDAKKLDQHLETLRQTVPTLDWDQDWDKDEEPDTED